MILELCKGVHCVDLGESFQTHIYLQNLASIQPRTSPVKSVRTAFSDSPGAEADLSDSRCAFAASAVHAVLAFSNCAPSFCILWRRSCAWRAERWCCKISVNYYHRRDLEHTFFQTYFQKFCSKCSAKFQ